MHEEESWLLAAAADVPSIIKQTMRIYQNQNQLGANKKSKEQEKEEEKLKKKKKKKKHGHGEILHLKEPEE